MILDLPAKIAIGIAVAAVLASIGMGFALKRSWQAEATTAAARDAALEANATLITERDRYKATAAAEAERAMARQRERDGMAAQMVELRRVLADDPCAWTPEKARALDRFLGGDTVK